MAFIPNWIQPLDVIRPMSAGAQLGLSVRAANRADQEMADQRARAADALNMQFAQLSQRAVEQQEAREIDRERAAESLRQHNALQRHWTAQEQQAAANAEARKRASLPLSGPVPAQTIVLPDGRTVPNWFAMTGAEGRPVAHAFTDPTLPVRTPRTPSFADREDVSDIDKALTESRKDVRESFPEGAPREQRRWPFSGNNPDFLKYQAATNQIAQLEAQKASILSKYRNQNQITEEKAREFLKQANGDKEKARALARQSGYAF